MKKHIININILAIAIASAAMAFSGCGMNHSEHEGHDHHHHESEEMEHEGHHHEHEGHHHDHEGEEHEGHHHEHEGEGHTDPGEITLSPEKALKYGVKSDTIKLAPFADAIHVTGEITAAQGDSYVAVAPSSGTISLSRNTVAGATVGKGALLATIKSDNVTGANDNDAARITLQTAKKELDRLTPLYKEKIVTQSTYNAALDAYKKAKLAYRPASKGGNSVSSALGGTITSVDVTEGQYVNAGDPICTVSRNARLTLRADLPESYRNRLGEISSASIKTPYLETPINLADLNGRRTSLSATTAVGGYLPIYFEFDNRGNIVSQGTMVEVYLTGNNKTNVLSVPIAAISEELGKYYLFVQLDEDCYDKRLVTLGRNNGVRVEILSGISDGEAVVTEGMPIVKLAASSGAIPAGHTHNH